MIWDNYRKEIESIRMEQQERLAMIDRLHDAEIKKITKLKKSNHYRMGIVSACMLLLGITFVLYSFSSTAPSETKTNHQQKISADLPKLKLPAIDLNGGYGLPVLREPDASYLKTDNPWLRQNVNRLPVYKNGIYTDGKETLLHGGLSDDELMERINHYAKTFAMGALKHKDTYSLMWSYVYENGSIEVNRNGTIHLLLHASEEQQKIFNIENTQLQSFEEAKAYSLLYAKSFKEQLALKQPVPSVHVDYNYDYENQKSYQNWTIGLYDKKGSITKDIASYNFASYQFNSLNLENSIEISIRINTFLVGEEIGEYPLISKQKAKEKFQLGSYQSLCPAPTEEISYMDVVYLFRNDTEYMIPFYRIYAPIKEEGDIVINVDGMNSYGIYYICAIEDQYIEEVSKENQNLKFN